MAELPEIEIARRDLDKDVGGRKIKSVEVPGAKRVVETAATKKAFVQALEGRKLATVRRAGKLFLFDIGDGELLVTDLGGTGAFRRATAKTDVEPNTQVIITFTQGGQLRMLDDGDNAQMAIVEADALDEAYPEIGALGFDPVDEPMSWTVFGQRLVRENRTLRELLLDDTFVVGLGPVYTDEILHAALLRHDRKANELITQEIRRLYRAIVETVHNAVKHRGVSLGDETDVFGEPGGYNEYLEVYDRAGERSRNGRGDVLSVKLGGVMHYYCDYQV
jgi:formamidopyrimidine-DNA glycosylase